MKKSLLVFLIIISLSFLAFSFYDYYNQYILNSLNLADLVIIVLANLAYLVPVSLVSFYFMKKCKIKLIYGFLAILFGGYLIGEVAGSMNAYFNFELANFINNDSYFSQIESSLVPPLVEEGLKLATVIVLTKLVNIKSLNGYILIGLLVGLGFQFSEDLSYLFYSHEADLSILEQAILRADGAFSTHFIWTSILSGAYFIYFKLKDRYLTSRVFLLSPILIHMLWNSPLVENLDIYPALSMVSFLIYYKLIDYAMYGKLILSDELLEEE